MMLMIRAFLVLVVLLAAAGVARAFEIQDVRSASGVRAWLVQSTHAPIVTLKFSMAGGATLDEPGKMGAAVLMGDMLNEGAGALNSEAFKLALAKMSSGVSLSASSDYLYGSVYCLKENCAKTVDLMRMALMEPRFEAKDFARVLAQRVQSLEQNERDQQSIGFEAWSAAAFPGHHYGRPTAGRAQDIDKLTVTDVQLLHRKSMVRRDLAVSAVGDIDAPTLSTYLDVMFAGLPVGNDLELAKTVEVAAGPQQRVIAYEGPQSMVFFGGPGLHADTPDRVTAYVLSELLGGGATFARLNQSLREKSGLTYGVSLGHAPSRYGAYMTGSFSTAKATVKQALSVLDAELAAMVRDGPTEEELRRIKSYLNGAFVLRLTSSDSIADMLLATLRDGRGLDFIEKRRARIEAVTVGDLKRVAGLLLAPEKRIVVVVGQAE